MIGPCSLYDLSGRNRKRQLAWTLKIFHPCRALLNLRLGPKPLHFVETGAFGRSAYLREAVLDMGEAAFELQVGLTQGGLGIHFKMARKVSGREQEVAHLVRERLRRPFSNFRLDLGDFLPDLRQDRADVVPVETAGRRLRSATGSRRGLIAEIGQHPAQIQ
jgi:hypothetical protein